MRVTLISIDVVRGYCRRYACGVTTSKIKPLITHEGTITLDDPKLLLCLDVFRSFPPETMKVA